MQRAAPYATFASPRGLLQKAANGLTKCLGGKCSGSRSSTLETASSSPNRHTIPTSNAEHTAAAASSPPNSSPPPSPSSTHTSSGTMFGENHHASTASSPSAHSSTYYGHLSSPSSFHPSGPFTGPSSVQSSPSEPLFTPSRTSNARTSIERSANLSLHTARLRNSPLRIGTSVPSQQSAVAPHTMKSADRGKGKVRHTFSGSSSSSNSPGWKPSSGAGPSGAKH
ncbi:unnamed protein product [Sympodiomycopsis kandeliae]